MTQIQVLEVCDNCGNADETVRDRICAYDQDINSKEVVEHICDACEHQHAMDI